MPNSEPFLHDLIDSYFGDDDLRELCFELGGVYDYDNLPGNTKHDKARELVVKALRRNELPLVLTKLQVERPGIQWEIAEVPALPIYLRPKGRKLIVLGLLAVLLAIGATATWLYFRPSRTWATYAKIPVDQLGIAVAEMGVGSDCRRSAAGREASALLYQTLETQIASVGLQKRAPLTKVGLVCSQEQAISEGDRVAADIVVWGWVPQTTEGILGQYTFVEPPTGPGAATLAQSLELLVSGPAQSRYYQLTGRTEALVRFVLGLVYAKDKDYKSSLAMFDRAIQIIESDESETPNSDSLAVLYTERGKTQAALKNPDLAFESYQKAELLNPEYIGLQVALGAYYYSQRDWGNARLYFEKADLQQEELPSIAYGFGLLDYYAGEYEAAINSFQLAVDRSLALDEEPLFPWLAMGYSYARMGRCAEATEVFDAILRSETAEVELRQTAEQEIANCAAAPTPIPITTLLPTVVGIQQTETPTPTRTPTSSPQPSAPPTTTATLLPLTPTATLLPTPPPPTEAPLPLPTTTPLPTETLLPPPTETLLPSPTETLLPAPTGTPGS